MIRTSPSLAAAILSVAVAATSVAQTPAQPASANLVANGSFESTVRTQNLWTGVDSTGFLTGFTAQSSILSAGGGIAPTPMPVSVSVADLNADNLPDIAAMDPMGYLRVYFNQGTPTEPKFGDAELASLFLSRTSLLDPELQDLVAAGTAGTNLGGLRWVRQAQRINLVDLNRSGRFDLLIGNFLGELMLIPNSGSPTRPDFRQPATIRQVLVPTTKDPTTRWANVISPLAFDWNRDGREDILLGEGSYSANSVHLLLNQGSSSRPVFNEDQRRIAAYGMGLEQLTPAIADYNGDGKMDLLVAERSGKIAVYLNMGKPDEPFEFFGFIPVNQSITPPTDATRKDPMDAAKASGLMNLGGTTTNAVACTVAAADLNGDGLFDLVFGRSSGRVAMSLNKGTKEKPVFAAPQDIKSAQPATKPFTPPSEWVGETGLGRGNFYGYITTVSVEEDPQLTPPDQKRVLKFGYYPSPNKFFPQPTNYLAAQPKFDFNKVSPFNGTGDPFLPGPANAFLIKQRVDMKPGKSYTLSMRVRGNGATNTSLRVSASGAIVYEQRQTRGDRGAVSIKSDQELINDTELMPVTVGPNWTEFRRDFTLQLSSPRAMKTIQDGKIPEGSSLEVNVVITTLLAPSSGELYVDDLKVIPKE